MLVCAESAWEGLPLRRAFSMVGCGWGGLPGLVFGPSLLGTRTWGLDRTDDAKRIVFSLSSLLNDEKLERATMCADMCSVRPALCLGALIEFAQPESALRGTRVRAHTYLCGGV